MKGEILMENEKKPSRLGVRLSAIVIAVLLVVCMAVPAFAYTVTPAEDSNQPFVIDIPDGYPYYIGWRRYYGGNYWYRVVAFTNLADARPYIQQSGDEYKIILGSSNYPAVYAGFHENGDISTDWTTYNASVTLSAKDQFWGNTILYNEDGSIFYSPPPPDPIGSVGSALTVVLDWVGATVSALFSGELSGLLPLVAIPVAVTILIVAIIVIKRSIWGA